MLYFGSSSTAELAPTQRVSVIVEGHVSLDSRTGIYAYSYSVANDSSSQNNVHFFSLGPIILPDSMAAPVHWAVDVYPYRGSSTAIGWFVNEMGRLPVGYVDTGNIPPSQFDLRPGERVSGFRFFSSLPPRVNAVRFFAQGFDTLPTGDVGDEDPQPDMFEIGVTGTTVGPDSSKTDRVRPHQRGGK